MAQSVNVRVKLTGAEQAQRQLAGLGAGLGRLQSKVFSLRGAFVGLAGAFAIKGIFAATIRQEKALAQLEARLKSTKGAAGLTSQELTKLASGLQKVTTFGDEAVIEAEALLLTFTKIGRDVFPDALRSVLDMSVAMGQDLKSSAIQLGKALNDPVGQMSALSRVGIILSETQQQQVKDFAAVGDIANAQKVILAELQTEFGGAAEAARNTLGGSLEALSNAFGDLLESDSLSGVRVEIEGLITDLQSPEVRKFADEVGTRLAGALREAAKAAAFLAKNMDLVLVGSTAFLGLRLGAAFGPLGAAIGLAGGALLGWIATMETATDRAKGFISEVHTLNASLDELSQRGINQLTRDLNLANLQLEQAELFLRAQPAAVRGLQEELARLKETIGIEQGGITIIDPKTGVDQLLTINRLQDRIDALNKQAEVTRKQLPELSLTIGNLTIALKAAEGAATNATIKIGESGDAAGHAGPKIEGFAASFKEVSKEAEKARATLIGFINAQIEVDRIADRAAFFGDVAPSGGRADARFKREQANRTRIARKGADERKKIEDEAEEERLASVARADASRKEQLQRVIDTLTDIRFHTEEVALSMHGSLAKFFEGVFSGALTLNQGLKVLFKDIAQSILAEFARIAASQVFRVLFGLGGNVGQQVGAQVLSQSGGSLLGSVSGGQGGLFGSLFGGGGIPTLGGGGGFGGGFGGFLGSSVFGSSAGASGGFGGLSGLINSGNAGVGGLANFGQLGSATLGNFGLPIIGNLITGAISGNIKGGILGAIGSALGFAFGGPVGGLLGSFAGNILGGLFQHGGDAIVTKPTLIGVGEVGPESVSVRPLAGRSSGGGGGVTLVFQGPTVIDDIGLQRFTNTVAQGVARANARSV